MKRIVSLFLCLCLTFGSVQMDALANESIDAEVAPTPYTTISTLLSPVFALVHTENRNDWLTTFVYRLQNELNENQDRISELEGYDDLIHFLESNGLYNLLDLLNNALPSDYKDVLMQALNDGIDQLILNLDDPFVRDLVWGIELNHALDAISQINGAESEADLHQWPNGVRESIARLGKLLANLNKLEAPYTILAISHAKELIVEDKDSNVVASYPAPVSVAEEEAAPVTDPAEQNEASESSEVIAGNDTAKTEQDASTAIQTPSEEPSNEQQYTSSANVEEQWYVTNEAYNNFFITLDASDVEVQMCILDSSWRIDYKTENQDNKLMGYRMSVNPGDDMGLPRVVPLERLCGSGRLWPVDELSFLDAADIQYLTAVRKLCEIEAITGKPGNLFEPQGELKREEAATILTKLLCGGDPGFKAQGNRMTAGFYDSDRRWSTPYIAFCAFDTESVNPIISGDGKNHFGPMDTLTVAAWEKMLLSILQYQETMTGIDWMDQVKRGRASYDLERDMVGFDNTLDRTITRDEACKLAANMLDALKEEGRSLSSNVVDATPAYSFLSELCRARGQASEADGARTLLISRKLDVPLDGDNYNIDFSLTYNDTDSENPYPLALVYSMDRLNSTIKFVTTIYPAKDENGIFLGTEYLERAGIPHLGSLELDSETYKAEDTPTHFSVYTVNGIDNDELQSILEEIFAVDSINVLTEANALLERYGFSVRDLGFKAVDLTD